MSTAPRLPTDLASAHPQLQHTGTVPLPLQWESSEFVESRDPVRASGPAGQTQGLEERGIQPVLKALVLEAEQAGKLTPTLQLKMGRCGESRPPVHVALVSGRPSWLCVRISAGPCWSERSRRGPAQCPLAEMGSVLPSSSLEQERKPLGPAPGGGRWGLWDGPES